MNKPTIEEFKDQFVRDFPYGTTSDKVMDSDIATAIVQSAFTANENLFEDEASYKFAFNYLAAHNLVMNLRGSSQGLGGSYSWLESSKSVGSVSQGFQIPEQIMKNPVFAVLSKTTYGAYYLSLILPLASGQIGTVAGSTQS